MGGIGVQMEYTFGTDNIYELVLYLSSGGMEVTALDFIDDRHPKTRKSSSNVAALRAQLVFYLLANIQSSYSPFSKI